MFSVCFLSLCNCRRDVLFGHPKSAPRVGGLIFGVKPIGGIHCGNERVLERRAQTLHVCGLQGKGELRGREGWRLQYKKVRRYGDREGEERACNEVNGAQARAGSITSPTPHRCRCPPPPPPPSWPASRPPPPSLGKKANRGSHPDHSNHPKQRTFNFNTSSFNTPNR